MLEINSISKVRYRHVFEYWNHCKTTADINDVI